MLATQLGAKELRLDGLDLTVRRDKDDDFF